MSRRRVAIDRHDRRGRARLPLTRGLAALCGWAGAFGLIASTLSPVLASARVPRIPLIRVGIAPEVAAAEVTAEGSWHLGIVDSGRRPTSIGAGETWRFTARGDSILVRDGEGRLRGAVGDTLFAYPDDAESGLLSVDGRPYRGELLVWGSKGRVTVVNLLDLESYLRAVLPLELGPQPPKRVEALKAQAVAARSYTLSMMGRWSSRGFDLLATVEDQVYGGRKAERAGCDEAVEETRGEIAFCDGAPVRAFYSSTCGGHTAAPDEVWKRPPETCLRGVRDHTGRVEGSFCKISPQFRWKQEWTGAEIEKVLTGSIPKVRSGWSRKKAGRLTGIEIAERSESRRVSKLKLKFEHGTVELGGDEIRWVLRRPNGEGLRSALLGKVEVSKKKGRISRVRIEGQGYGHGVGMCQFGAMGMAEAGYRHEQIIRFYYRGVKLARLY